MPEELVGAFAVLYEDTFKRTEQALDDLAELRRTYSGRVEDRSYLNFIGALELMLETLRTRLDALRDRFSKETANGSVTEAANSDYDTVRGLAGHMTELLEGQVQLLRMPRSDELEVFAEPLTRLTKRLVSNAEVLFFPWVSLGGYRQQAFDSTYVKPLGAVMGENLERAFGADIQFLRLRHPSPRRSDLFEHPVFAHEVAHAAIERRVPANVRSKLRARDNRAGLPPAFGSGEAALTPSFLTVAWDYAERKHPGARDHTRLRQWAKEMACDMVAFRLVGPAFLVAYCEVTAVNRTIEGGAQESYEHPPPSLRFERLESEMRRFDFSPAGAQVQGVMHDYIATHRATSSAPVIPADRGWVMAALERFEDTLADLLGPLEYTPAMLQSDLPEVLRLADANIPPAERLLALGHAAALPREGDEDTPAWSVEFDWRSILNGVLLHFLRDHGTPGVTEEVNREKARRNAVKLALAAIELSEFQRKSRALQSQYQDLHIDRGESR